MFDLRGRSSLHREAGVAENDEGNFGLQPSKIMFKSCQTESDRFRHPENVTVTRPHVPSCNASSPSTGLASPRVVGDCITADTNVITEILHFLYPNLEQ